MKLKSKFALVKSFILFVFVIASFASCKTFNPHLNPEPEIAPPAFSSVNVPVQIPKKTLDKIFNQAIPQVLVNDESIGSGNFEGNLLLTRNGSPFYTALDSQRIQLTLPLKLQGEIGLKRGGLGSFIQSKIPLDETLTPVFILNPSINPDWSISIADFELVDLGGKLALSVLGMEVDLSGLLEKEINRWGEQNLNSSKSIVSLKTFIDLAWNQVGRPFTINWEGEASTFSIQPDSVKLQEFFDQEDQLNVWLGLNGKVNTHPVNASPSRAFPLPKLSPNLDSENHLEITLPWVLDYEKLNQLLGENLNNRPIRVDKKTILTPNNIQSQSFGDLLKITMDFMAEQTNGKSLDGKLYIIGKPAYDAENQNLYFTDINFKLESGNLGAQTSIGLKKKKIIRNIEKRAVFPIGDYLDEGMLSIQDRLALKTGIADLQIIDLVITPEDFYPTKNGLTVHMKARGKVNFDWK
ncbi:DUF4403 family protein [Algoriphagus halophilus]|uniref:DUF4403 family protein n=1 Tax=Algoriphagus halophilus TaxID=226505 RepID=A0A1N6FSL0_9BACT|nr:DUF4403 family protein [Algoriphagus halophilus]SIN98326.1 protein of unknown function [Algoriphagus halophilus]